MNRRNFGALWEDLIKRNDELVVPNEPALGFTTHSEPLPRELTISDLLAEPMKMDDKAEHFSVEPASIPEQSSGRDDIPAESEKERPSFVQNDVEIVAMEDMSAISKLAESEFQDLMKLQEPLDVPDMLDFSQFCDLFYGEMEQSEESMQPDQLEPVVGSLSEEQIPAVKKARPSLNRAISLFPPLGDLDWASREVSRRSYEDSTKDVSDEACREKQKGKRGSSTRSDTSRSRERQPAKRRKKAATSSKLTSQEEKARVLKDLVRECSIWTVCGLVACVPVALRGSSSTTPNDSGLMDRHPVEELVFSVEILRYILKNLYPSHPAMKDELQLYELLLAKDAEDEQKMRFYPSSPEAIEIAKMVLPVKRGAPEIVKHARTFRREGFDASLRSPVRVNDRGFFELDQHSRFRLPDNMILGEGSDAESLQQTASSASYSFSESSFPAEDGVSSSEAQSNRRRIASDSSRELFCSIKLEDFRRFPCRKGNMLKTKLFYHDGIVLKKLGQHVFSVFDFQKLDSQERALFANDGWLRYKMLAGAPLNSEILAAYCKLHLRLCSPSSAKDVPDLFHYHTIDFNEQFLVSPSSCPVLDRATTLRKILAEHPEGSSCPSSSSQPCK